jgi:aspartyl/asparaginyl beta-hydroxylase (cupin superfamily)
MPQAMKARTTSGTRPYAARELLRDLERQVDRSRLRRIRGLLEVWSGRRAHWVRPYQRVHGLFLPGLKTTPWLDPRRFPFASSLEGAAPTIAKELNALSEGEFTEYGGLGLPGWREFTLCKQNKEDRDKCARCPVTASLIATVQRSHVYVNQFTFLCLEPNTTLADHADPNNYLVSVHLPLVVPPRSGLSVAGDARSYVTAKCLAFDNSFLHRAWNHGRRRRIILAVQTFHPDLTDTEMHVLAMLHGSLAQADVPS